MKLQKEKKIGTILLMLNVGLLACEILFFNFPTQHVIRKLNGTKEKCFECGSTIIHWMSYFLFY